MNKQIHIIYKYDSNKKHTNKKFTSFQFELFQGGLHIYYSTQTVCIFETYIYDMWNGIGYLLIRRLHIQYTHIYRYIWLYLCFEVRLLRWRYVCDVDFVQVEYGNNQNILKAHDYQYKYISFVLNIMNGVEFDLKSVVRRLRYILHEFQTGFQRWDE